MKMLRQYFFLLALIIEGCQGNITQTTKLNNSGTTEYKKKKVVRNFHNVSCDTTIVNNNFSINTLAYKIFKADTTKIKLLFLNPVILKLQIQKNPNGGSYDLYNFSDRINKLILYNNNGFYLQEAIIKDDKILLNKKIAIGMTKDSFLKLIKLPSSKCDTITVVDEESTFETVYIFNGSKLKQINMGQIVE
jgi:hypothetical protein